MGLWLLRLTVKILANLRLTVSMFPLWSPERFLTFLTNNGQNLSIFFTQQLNFWPFYCKQLTPLRPSTKREPRKG